ncbi:toll-like receptor 2 [Haliotis rubra]|uniref:toll-like receptor 2 n=1 Tax=Haliotis rubra TaxID=36100 RepID=UPI001EE62C9C|nr:toll-like receptor 2 [Haliotis rubra]
MARLLEITICAMACAIALTSNAEGETVVCGNVSRPCFECLCSCSAKCVRCINNGANLTQIPDLQPTTEFLNFSSNHLGELTRDMFRNISQLKILILRNNSITNISRDAFQDMLMLEILDLRYSRVSESVLQKSFYSLQNNLRSLDLSANRFLRNITDDFIDGLTRLNIHVFKMEFCRIKYVNFSVISRLKSLRTLSFVHNDIFWTTADVPSHLTHISLRSNSLTQLPGLCVHTNSSQLQSLDIRENAIRYISNASLKCLKKLDYFNAIENLILKIHSNTFSSLPKLQFIAISNAFRSYFPQKRLEEYAFNNSAVKKLYLSGIAKFGYFDSIVSPKALRGCTGLTWLDLSYNTMLYFNDSFLETVFYRIQKLEVLRMPRCQLSFFPKVISNLRELKEIDLHGNRIMFLPSGVFTSLTKLRRIRLSQNSIQIVSEDVFPIPIRNQLTYLNLATNDYLCTCANLWYITWAKADKHIFTDFPESYQCGYPLNLKSTLLIDANISEQTCRISPYVFPIVFGLSLVSIVLVVVLSIAYRLRWSIRYCLHMLRYKRRKPIDETIYIYDAFVLYCEGDSPWVRNNIIPRIEDEANFKLCIHERDFIPGEYIVDNIVTSLESSRKVIMVLSNSFILSSWCQFELALIQKRALEKDEGYLLVVLLENIESRNMTSSLYALFQTTTYITWPEEEEDRHVFWMRLKQSLQG